MKYIKYSETEKKFEQAPSVKQLPDGRTIYRIRQAIKQRDASG